MALLVVDDDPVVRAFAARALAPLTDVRTYADAVAAMGAVAAAEGVIELVVADIEMPGHIDGIGLALALSAADPPIPVVLISGDPDALARARGLPNVRAVLCKPFTLAELRASVEGVVEHVA